MKRELREKFSFFLKLPFTEYKTMTEKPTDKVNTNNDQVIEIKENAESSNIDKPGVAGWRSLMNMFCASNQKAEVKMFKI